MINAPMTFLLKQSAKYNGGALKISPIIFVLQELNLGSETL